MSSTTEFRPISTISGSDYSVFGFQEEGAVAQAFKPGNLVVINTEGRIQEAADGEASVLGSPLEVASGSEGGPGNVVPVFLLDFQTIWEAPVEAESAIDTDNELQALIGDAHKDLTVTAGLHMVSTAESADNCFMLVGGDISNSDRRRVHLIAGSTCQWIMDAAGGWTQATVVS